MYLDFKNQIKNVPLSLLVFFPQELLEASGSSPACIMLSNK
jgi:hypothetical protein